MNVFKTPRSARAERKRAERLDIARRLYQALAAQDPDRVITLCDGGGRVVARHDPRPEQDAPVNQWVKHRVVGNIPLSLRERYKLPNDATGIDGIYEMHDGSHVAYQVKYRQKNQLSFAEVAPFLGITEQFSDRVIFTNAARLPHKALVRTRWVSADVFRNLSFDALSSIEAWIKVKPIAAVKAKPDPSYQVQVLADIKETLAKRDRATAVMACGSGKTLVALWTAGQKAPKTVLVLVPSLTLLQQTLREWSEAKLLITAKAMSPTLIGCGCDTSYSKAG
jgi:predicted helicase